MYVYMQTYKTCMKCWVLYRRQLDLFQFLKMFQLIQDASSLLTNWRGVAGLNYVWECPYIVL